MINSFSHNLIFKLDNHIQDNSELEAQFQIHIIRIRLFAKLEYSAQHELN